MKPKLVLAALVIGGFAAYSLHSKHGISPTAAATLPRSNSVTTQTPVTSNGTPIKYKDGSYTGRVADAFYGNIQVKATIQGGKLTDVQFLQYPNDQPNSIAVNQQSMPVLRQEALQAQSAQVDTVSGATDTSQAFVQSLGAALASAQS